jgi:hypothetical protein
MHFIGSHMPFLPRTNRCLLKRDGFLRGLVSGKEVIQFATRSRWTSPKSASAATTRV